MACNNCYNGCVETTSDKCVRYTGLPSEALGIETNDSLFVVEEALINAVVSFLDGTGIDITIDPAAYCDLVVDYLPSCKPICSPPTAVELFEALVKAACDLQAQVTVIDATLATLNADYTIECLTGVTASSDTHAIVQAIINKLCDLGVDLAALAIDVDTNYVKLADLNTLIQAYLDSISGSTSFYTKMVPYTVVEYYGNLSGYPTVTDGFGPTGVGFGAWQNVYLCNGQNGTPDKRGRVPVGVTNGMGGGAFNPVVDPGVSGNPTYTISSTAGANTVTLTSAQIPAHTHPASAIVTDTHYHHEFANTVNTTDVVVNSVDQVARALNLDPSSNLEYTMNATSLPATVGKTSQTAGGSISAAITVANNTGGGGAHSNIQPVLACYYIMYIP
jgi:microcystin-dependent protein